MRCSDGQTNVDPTYLAIIYDARYLGDTTFSDASWKNNTPIICSKTNILGYYLIDINLLRELQQTYTARLYNVERHGLCNTSIKISCYQYILNLSLVKSLVKLNK